MVFKNKELTDDKALLPQYSTSTERTEVKESVTVQQPMSEKLIGVLTRYVHSLSDLITFFDRSYSNITREFIDKKLSKQIPIKLSSAIFDGSRINSILQEKHIMIDGIISLANELNIGCISAQYSCKCIREAKCECSDQGDWKFKVTEQSIWVDYVVNLFYELDLPNESFHIPLVSLKLENKAPDREYMYQVPGGRSHVRHQHINEYHDRLKSKLGVGKYQIGSCNLPQSFLDQSTLSNHTDSITTHQIEVDNILSKLIEALLTKDTSKCQEFRQNLLADQQSAYKAKMDTVEAQYKLIKHYAKQDIEIDDPSLVIGESFSIDANKFIRPLSSGSSALCMFEESKNTVMEIKEQIKKLIPSDPGLASPGCSSSTRVSIRLS